MNISEVHDHASSRRIKIGELKQLVPFGLLAVLGVTVEHSSLITHHLETYAGNRN
jgi:hypothetical protein